MKVLLFSHWVNQHLCDKSTVKPTWFSPLLHFSASISFSFLPSSQVWWLSAIMPVSMSPAAAEQSAGRPVRLPLAPCCEHCSGGGTEWESGELLIPCTIGHLNPRQAPYLHWAKALPEPYDSRQNDHPSPCSQGSIIHEKRWMGCKQGMLTEGWGVLPEECVLSPVCLSN